jgi:hypothetical protein
MRVLIIEDRQALAEEYLRIFNHILKGDYSYTHVPSVEAALSPLAEENWDVIFIDNELGQGAVYPPGSEDGIRLNNGYDLVRFRRDIEDTTDGVSKSYIIGIAANRVALTFFGDVGADDGMLKLHIPEMAERIQEIAPLNT